MWCRGSRGRRRYDIGDSVVEECEQLFRLFDRILDLLRLSTPTSRNADNVLAYLPPVTQNVVLGDALPSLYVLPERVTPVE